SPHPAPARTAGRRRPGGRTPVAAGRCPTVRASPPHTPSPSAPPALSWCLRTWMVTIAACVSVAGAACSYPQKQIPSDPAATRGRSGAALLAARPNTGRLERRRHGGEHGHGCRQGPVLGDVQGAGGGGIGPARRA